MILKIEVRMVQRYFIESWLLPCSLRSHRTADPRQKMGFAIFRLCPPTTQIQALYASRATDRAKCEKIIVKNIFPRL